MSTQLAQPSRPTRIGELGVWTWLDSFSSPDAAEFARTIESWGYSALWIPEAVGRDPFTFLGYLASQTEQLVLATGIANIYARDAMAMNAVRQTLSEIAPGRFVLGLGVSHEVMVSGLRGHDYGRPVSTMREYLEAMGKAPYAGFPAAEEAPIVLGALREKMLGLAAERARGAHPFAVTPEHTRRAREIMGPDAWLCPHQKVLLETSPSRAREIGRKSLAVHLTLPNYRSSWMQQGFEDSDFQDGGSDRLVDGLVAWGDEKAITERVQAHRDAGATHVCIDPLDPAGGMTPDRRVLEALAPKS